MYLIKKLGIKKSIIGNSYSSYGLFLCPFCLQKVEKVLGAGVKAKSCGCVSNKLMSETRIKKELSKGKNNPMYGVHRFGNKAPMYGKKHTNETRIIISNSRKGKSSYWKGKKFTEEYKQKIRENHADFKMEKHPQWQGGKSFEIYPKEFNKNLKKFIKIRDNYKCQDPNCNKNYKKLHIHHIDYDKKNNNQENLITLCNSCHAKTNHGNRSNWIEYYKNIIINNRIWVCE